MNLLILNGSLRGQTGNTGRVTEILARLANARGLDGTVLTLAEPRPRHRWEAAMREADALFVLTGAYWGSCGSVLQGWLEEATPHEGTDLFLGKPVAVGITSDSVGGLGVALRLIYALNCFGCVLPAQGMVIISRVANELIRERGDLHPDVQDVWGARDLATALDHLLATPRIEYESWDVERGSGVRDFDPFYPFDLGEDG